MQRIRLALVFFFVAVAFHLTWYSLMWVKLAGSPGGYESTDFRGLYVAGRLVHAGHLSDLYDLELQYNFQTNYFGVLFNLTDLLSFNHPPILIPIQALLFSENYAASYWRWCIFLAILLVGSSTLIARLLLIRKWDRVSTVVAVLGWLLFYPAFLSVFKGQDTALLLLGATIWLYGLLTGNDRLAGLGLALTTIRPQIALMLAIPFLFKRRQVWWWFCFGASLLVIYSVAMLGPQGTQGFWQVLLISARGEGYGISQSTMFNLMGVIFRLFPEADAQLVHLSVWIIYILAILFLCFVWRKSREIGTRQITLAVVFSAFVATHLHYHDLSILLLAIFCATVDIVNQRILSSRNAMLIPLGLSTLMILTEVTSLRYWGPYILMAVLVAWPWLIDKIPAICRQSFSTRT